jgi:chromate transporter
MMQALPWSDLAALFGHFLLLSMLAVGGVIVVAPDVHRVMVTQMGLLTDPQFSACIAIAQASPGPNFLYVSVAGYLAAGLPGALVTTVGLLLPSTTLAFVAARWGHRHRERRAIKAFNAGMAPVVIALLAATAWILSAQAPGWKPLLLTVPAALLVWRTRIHLLWLIAAGGVVGALGWM